MIKKSMKNLVLAGLVGLITSAAAWATPLSNNDQLDAFTPGLYYDIDSAGNATMLYDGASAEHTNHIQGSNAAINTAAFNPLLGCTTELVDILPAQAFQQLVAWIQSAYFIKVEENVGGVTVYKDSDLKRLINACSAKTGITQLSGGGDLFRFVVFFLSGQWQGQTPGVCYAASMDKLLVKLQQYHIAGNVLVPQDVKDLLNLDQNDPSLGTESCLHWFCNPGNPLGESEFINSFCPQGNYIW